MTDIASLGIKATTQGVKEAASDLDKLDASGKKVEKSLGGIATSGAKTEKATKSASKALQEGGEAAKGMAQGLGKLSASTAQVQNNFATLGRALATGNIPQAKNSVVSLTANTGLLSGAASAAILPITLLGGAALALAVAYKKGNDESVAFNKALIVTGGYAGVTAIQLQQMSERLSDTVGTQHAAAAALAEVASSGKFTGQQLEYVTKAALALKEIGGQSIQETIKLFAGLKEDPVKAAVELDEKIHFLTKSVYDQVKALQEQGRAQEAFDLIAKESSRELDRRRAEIVANAGYIEQAWAAVTKKANEAWDAILNVGRATTNLDKIKQIQSNIAGVESGTGVYLNIDPATKQRLLQKFRNDIKALQAESEKSAAAAAREGKASAARSAAFALDQEADSYASAEVKRAKRIAEAHTKANIAVADAIESGNSDLVKSIRESEKKIVAGIEAEASKAAGGGRGGGRARSALAKALPDFSGKAAAELEKLAAQEDRATQSFLDMKATLDGPLAEALRDHEKRVSQLNALAAQSPTAAAGLSAALEQEAQRYDQATDAIKRQLDPVGEILRYQAQELDMIGKSNAERDVMNALLEKGIDLRGREAQAALAQARANQEEAESRNRAIRLMDDFRSGASNALADFITGAKSAKSALMEFFDALNAQITRAITDNWMEKLFGPQGSDGSGTSGGNFLSGLIGALLGGGGRASGGPVKAGHAYPITERGEPEILSMGGRNYLIPPAGGQVMPISQASTPAANSSQIINQSIYVAGSLDKRSAGQVARDTAYRLRIASARA